MVGTVADPAQEGLRIAVAELRLGLSKSCSMREEHIVRPLSRGRHSEARPHAHQGGGRVHRPRRELAQVVLNRFHRGLEVAEAVLPWLWQELLLLWRRVSKIKHTARRGLMYKQVTHHFVT